MEFSILFFAPFYNRSGYGVAARGLAAAWQRRGIPLRIVPVDEVEEGLDDCDLNQLKSLESAQVSVPLAAIFFHVPSPAWLSVELPTGCLRIMYTTFDGYARGGQPPSMWIRICNEMDQIWVMSEQEAAVWVQAGAEPSKLRVLPAPHPWVDNPSLPPLALEAKPEGAAFRFLSMGMFQPRRRWDTLIEAFLLEFRETPGVELVLKVNYPSWHPVPGRPQQDLRELIEGLKARTGSRAMVHLDDGLGTRLGVCRLMDSCDFYVSTDTTSTAPISEAQVRGKLTILPESYGRNFGETAALFIPEDARHHMAMTEAMLAYQPHHRGTSMPLLRVEDLRPVLRAAFEMPETERRARGRATALSAAEGSGSAVIQRFLDALREGFETKQQALSHRVSSGPAGIRSRWEGSQFVFHSLAHVNRQLCLGLVGSGQVELSLIPYEPDQFQGASSPFKALAGCVRKPLTGPAAVHVRHQWPPNFNPPPEGAWVMIQPWEFGGIPAEWVGPMREKVDEIWVPSSWVKACYVKSGIPEDRVVVIPNGVDPEVFRPEGERFPLRTTKGYKFLFLGGTIHRKGIDVLLEAYRKTFRDTDDVCLVIKGQGGGVYQGQSLDETLERIGREDPQAPEIEYRVEDMDESRIASLYRTCDALVLPYRGEGFGLPIAEAMASGLPVIVTGRGAGMDFVREDWGYLIPSRVQPLSHVDEFQPGPAGFWLEEPDVEALAALLRRAYENPEEGREKGRRGREYAASELTWAGPVRLVLERLGVLASRRPRRFGDPAANGVPSGPEALLYEPDWAQAEWVEVLLTYLQAFAPGEPVALVLSLGEGPSSPTPEAAQQAVLQIVTRTGRESFPDIVIADSPGELTEILARYRRVQRIPSGRGKVDGLAGAFGLRFAQARQRMSGA